MLSYGHPYHTNAAIKDPPPHTDYFFQRRKSFGSSPSLRTPSQHRPSLERGDTPTEEGSQGLSGRTSVQTILQPYYNRNRINNNNSKSRSRSTGASSQPLTEVSPLTPTPFIRHHNHHHNDPDEGRKRVSLGDVTLEESVVKGLLQYLEKETQKQNHHNHNKENHPPTLTNRSANRPPPSKKVEPHPKERTSQPPTTRESEIVKNNNCTRTFIDCHPHCNNNTDKAQVAVCQQCGTQVRQLRDSYKQVTLNLITEIHKMETEKEKKEVLIQKLSKNLLHVIEKQSNNPPPNNNNNSFERWCQSQQGVLAQLRTSMQGLDHDLVELKQMIKASKEDDIANTNTHYYPDKKKSTLEDDVFSVVEVQYDRRLTALERHQTAMATTLEKLNRLVSVSLQPFQEAVEGARTGNTTSSTTSGGNDKNNFSDSTNNNNNASGYDLHLYQSVLSSGLFDPPLRDHSVGGNSSTTTTYSGVRGMDVLRI